MENVDIIINEECNFKCDFCLLKITEWKLDYNDFSLKKINDTLILGRSNWLNSLCISWWEPTISKNLFKVLALWVHYWYKDISLVTNWFVLNDDFCKKLKKYWVNKLYMSMTWYNAEIFEKQVWVEGVFDTFIDNLKTALTFFDIAINIVVNNLNIEFLIEQWNLLKNLGVKNVNLLHAIPYKDNDKTLPTNASIKKNINEFINVFDKDFNINLEFFPFCLIDDKKYIVLESNELSDIENQDQASKRRENSFRYKKIADKCKSCEYLNDCNWFWNN